MTAAKPDNSDSAQGLTSLRRESATLRAELGALVDSAACACPALFNASFLAPHRLEPPHVSGDDEHRWIGLVP